MYRLDQLQTSLENHPKIISVEPSTAFGSDGFTVVVKSIDEYDVLEDLDDHFVNGGSSFDKPSKGYTKISLYPREETQQTRDIINKGLGMESIADKLIDLQLRGKGSIHKTINTIYETDGEDLVIDTEPNGDNEEDTEEDEVIVSTITGVFPEDLFDGWNKESYDENLIKFIHPYSEDTYFECKVGNAEEEIDSGDNEDLEDEELSVDEAVVATEDEEDIFDKLDLSGVEQGSDEEETEIDENGPYTITLQWTKDFDVDTSDYEKPTGETSVIEGDDGLFKFVGEFGSLDELNNSASIVTGMLAAIPVEATEGDEDVDSDIDSEEDMEESIFNLIGIPSLNEQDEPTDLDDKAFEAGNYANSYEGGDYEDALRDSKYGDLPEESTERAMFIAGWFSDHSEDEMLSENEEAQNAYQLAMRFGFIDSDDIEGSEEFEDEELQALESFFDDFDLDTLTEEKDITQRIRELKQEAGKAGDTEQVKICNKALAGDEESIELCKEVFKSKEDMGESRIEEANQNVIAYFHKDDKSIPVGYYSRSGVLNPSQDNAMVFDGRPDKLFTDRANGVLGNLGNGTAYSTKVVPAHSILVEEE